MTPREACIKELYEDEGLSLSSIGGLYGMNATKVSDILKRIGVTIRPRNPENARKSKTQIPIGPSDADLEEIEITMTFNRPTALERVRQLEKEVSRLQRRVEDLESRQSKI